MLIMLNTRPVLQLNNPFTPVSVSGITCKHIVAMQFIASVTTTTVVAKYGIVINLHFLYVPEHIVMTN